MTYDNGTESRYVGYRAFGNEHSNINIKCVVTSHVRQPCLLLLLLNVRIAMPKATSKTQSRRPQLAQVLFVVAGSSALPAPAPQV